MVTLASLELVAFRNIRKEILSFSPGLNVLYGENGQGKSNLLEAIALVSRGRSFRVTQFAPLILHQESSFHVAGHFFREGMEQRLALSYDGEERRFFYQKTRYRSFSELIGLLPSVMISPEELQLVGGAPAHRRRFLDLHLSQIDPLAVYHLSRLQRALRQRNASLRTKDLRAVRSWSEAMASSVSYITQARYRAVATLNTYLQEYVAPFLPTSQKGGCTLSYQSKLTEERCRPEDFLESLSRQEKREIALGATLVGPHRDDLLMMIHGQSAQHYGSLGQQALFGFALRLAEAKKMEEEIGHSPLVLIDDFGLGLDPMRQQLLWKYVKEMSQVIVTTTSIDQLPFPPQNLLRVSQGTIK